MKRNLSSFATFYFKLVLPSLWIIAFGVEVIAVFLKDDSSASPPPKFFLLAFWIVGTAFLYKYGILFKRVSIDHESLYVSNYLKEIIIPLSNISSVTENKWINMRPVTIYLRASSEFGDKITFMPKLKPFLYFGSHPVVAELRAAADIEKWDLDL